MNDKKIELYTIVYTIQGQSLGNINPYSVKNSYEEPVEPEITDFSDATALISKIKAAL